MLAPYPKGHRFKPQGLQKIQTFFLINLKLAIFQNIIRKYGNFYLVYEHLKTPHAHMNSQWVAGSNPNISKKNQTFFFINLKLAIFQNTIRKYRNFYLVYKHLKTHHAHMHSQCVAGSK